MESKRISLITRKVTVIDARNTGAMMGRTLSIDWTEYGPVYKKRCVSMIIRSKKDIK